MKKFKKKKIIIPIVIVVVIIIIANMFGGNAATIYTEEAAEVRDVVTYHNFNGNVEAEDSLSIMSPAAVKVLDVLVDEGDFVKEGDVIAILDSDSIEQTIEMREAALSITEKSNYYSQRDAQKAYEDYKESVDAGLNAQLISAENAVNSAHSQALMAQQSLDAAVATYESSDMYRATKSAYETAKQAFESVKSQYEAADDAGKAALKADYDAKNAAYETALNSYNAIEEAKNASTKQLSDAVLLAINTYNVALESFEATKQSVNQTMESYANTVEKVNGVSSTETSQLELDNLYKQLEDYTVKATMDGVITELNLKKGAMASMTAPAVEISDMNNMKIAIRIDEYDILGTEEGKEVSIYIDSIGKTYDGKITKISRKATTVNGVSYFNAEVEFAADEDVRSGMSVEVKLTSKEALETVSISMKALRYEEDNSAYVLVKNAEGKEEKRYVKVGITDGSYVQIEEGLSSGEVVLVSPQFDYAQLMMEMN